MNKHEMQDKLVEQLETYKKQMPDNFNSSRNENLKNNMLALVVFALECGVISNSEMNDFRKKYKIG